MKKFGFLIPILLFLGFSLLSTRLFASGAMTPTTLIILVIGLFVVMMLFRPKTAAPKPIDEVEEKIRGDFAKDAFSDNPQLAAKFQAALKDYAGNMPKASFSKLEKIAPQCKTDEEIYAVSLATASVLTSLGKHKEASRHYNKAVVLHPTADVAMNLGTSYQRQGELAKARDSYEFALELEPENLDVRSVLATAYVASGDYETGLEHALLVLEKDENQASALATAAICNGLMNNAILEKHYTNKAVENGYSEKKITETISALKKR